MEPIVAAVLFLFGAIVASFMGLVTARLYTGQTIVSGRSACDACGVALPAWSLVPFISYAVGRGRAQCCGSRISIVAPLSELALGLLFVLSYASLGLSPALPGMLVSFSLLTGLVLYDLAHQILPPVLLSAFVGAAAVTGYTTYPEFLTSVVPMALGLGGVLLFIHLVSRGRAMGFSDAPLTFGLGLLTGPVALSGFVYSFWIGAVIGMIVLSRRPAGSRMRVEVPFAPYLAAGFILAYATQWNLFNLPALLLQ